MWPNGRSLSASDQPTLIQPMKLTIAAIVLFHLGFYALFVLANH